MIIRSGWAWDGVGGLNYELEMRHVNDDMHMKS